MLEHATDRGCVALVDLAHERVVRVGRRPVARDHHRNTDDPAACRVDEREQVPGARHRGPRSKRVGRLPQQGAERGAIVRQVDGVEAPRKRFERVQVGGLCFANEEHASP